MLLRFVCLSRRLAGFLPLLFCAGFFLLANASLAAAQLPTPGAPNAPNEPNGPHPPKPTGRNGATATAAPVGAHARPLPTAKPTVIVYKSMPFTGWYVDSDAERFTFRLQPDAQGHGGELTLPWDGATPDERANLIHQFGLPAVGDTPVFGDKINAERITLKTGTVYFGFTTLVADDQGKTVVSLTTRQIKTLILDPSEIASVEEVPAYESQVYSNQEIYTRHKLSGDRVHTAADHYKLAVLCLKLYLPDEGLEQMDMAAAIDPRFQADEGPIAQLHDDLKQQQQRKAGDDLVRSMNERVNDHDYAGAHADAARFLKLFPDHPMAHYVLKLLGLIDEREEAEQAAEAISGVYAGLPVFIREKVTTSVSTGVTMPGKRVLGTAGQVWQGQVQMETAEFITLLIPTSGGEARPFKIYKTNVLRVQDIQIAPADTGPKVAPTWQVIKSWIESGRMTTELFARVAQKTHLTPDQVKHYWEQRGQVEMVLDTNGKLVIPRDNRRRITIDVGDGSFLLNNMNFMMAGGRRGFFRPPTQSAAQLAASAAQKTTFSGATGQPGANGATTAAAAGPTPQEIQPLTDTEWWTAANDTDRTEVALGLAAVKMLAIESSTTYTCPTCGGKGYVTSVDGNGDAVYKCCPTCNGNEQLIKMVGQ